MKRMNFRQRISWLCVAFYLVATCAIVYYLFEISDRFNEFALDHINNYHKTVLVENKDNAETEPESRSVWSLFGHVADIPLAVWLVLLFIPYLQVFAMLLACTKPNPQFSMAYMWPIYSIMWFQDKCGLNKTSDVTKASNCPVANGKAVLET